MNRRRCSSAPQQAPSPYSCTERLQIPHKRSQPPQRREEDAEAAAATAVTTGELREAAAQEAVGREVAGAVAAETAEEAKEAAELAGVAKAAAVKAVVA